MNTCISICDKVFKRCLPSRSGARANIKLNVDSMLSFLCEKLILE